MNTSEGKLLNLLPEELKTRVIEKIKRKKVRTSKKEAFI